MDSRFNLKIEFTIYGKTFPWNCSLNWCAPDGRIDPRIEEFFRDAHDNALMDREQEMFDASARRSARERESHELAELARLKAKYESCAT